MAKATFETVIALRNTARHLQTTTTYQWGHMGSCNCGFLAQQITALTKTEIHRGAMERSGDWTEQLQDYCAASGLRIDWIIGRLLDAGFTISDLQHLERLSDPTILRTLPERRYLRHNVKSDVVVYLNQWASLLETELVENIELPDHDLRPTATPPQSKKNPKLELESRNLKSETTRN